MYYNYLNKLIQAKKEKTVDHSIGITNKIKQLQ